MSLIIALAVLAWLLIGMVLMYVDVRALAEHESTLDELWGEDE